MLKERSLALQRTLFVADLGLLVVAWALAFFVRFRLLHPASPWYVGDVPMLELTQHDALMPWAAYFRFLPIVVPVWGVVLLLSGLYQTRRAQRLPLVVYGVVRAVVLGLVVTLGVLFFYREFAFSRLHVLLFGVLSSSLLVGLRLAIYAGLRRARVRGKNLRRVLIVGAGRTGQRLARAFQAYPWMGFEVVGFLDDEPAPDKPKLLGTIDALPRTLDRLMEAGRSVDLVYVALPLRAAGRIETLVRQAEPRLAHVALVPDLFHLDLVMNQRISEVDGLPVIHLIDEAPFDARRAVKRLLDVAFSAAVLVLLSPLLLALAAAVKLSSPGPVFYRQERMGLNGQTFGMLKFRSMPVNAEAKTGAVWAKSGENRATPVGAFLRKTSLDELPQFLNVLKGDMSVVGPRPERPVFIERFKGEIPQYMLRHKMKAGITGWAQVNGWRGNTSLEKRIEYDLYYIRNWSLMLDIRIMWMTLFTGFVNEHAY
jgi:Undecaprenyl-phosphate glucose phosphotransferase